MALVQRPPAPGVTLRGQTCNLAYHVYSMRAASLYLSELLSVGKVIHSNGQEDVEESVWSFAKVSGKFKLSITYQTINRYVHSDEESYFYKATINDFTVVGLNSVPLDSRKVN